jgi:short-subunit dehydrogenase
MQLNSRTVVLTGAASGIGRALAIKLFEQQCSLALVDRDAAGLEALVAELPSHASVKVTTHTVDLADRDASLALIDQIASQHKTIHMLVNNAGVALGGTFEQTSVDNFDWLMRINFGAVVDLTRGFLALMQAHGEPAKIVNISSLFGLVSPPEQSAYCASKFAVRGFSNALGYELRGTPVSMLVVHPGGIATAIARNARIPEGVSESEVAQRQKQASRLLKKPPMEAAEEIVKAILSDRTRLLIGSDAKLIALIERIWPERYWRIVEKLINRKSA